MTQKFEIKWRWNDDEKKEVHTTILENCWALMGYLAEMSRYTNKPDGQYLISVKEIK